MLMGCFYGVCDVELTHIASCVAAFVICVYICGPVCVYQFQLGVHVICCLDELCVTWYECLWQWQPLYGLYCVSVPARCTCDLLFG